MAVAPTLTRNRILDVAQRLIQARGFSAFSYADIATDIGIRKASIHHHFPTKGELAVALMQRYRATFDAMLAGIEQDHARVGRRLEAYQELFTNVLRDGHRLCMCGMFAADFEALPAAARDEVRGFFDSNERWLAKVLTEGKRLGQASFRGTATTQARVLLSTFEGAMLVARTHGDIKRFEAVACSVIDNVLRAA